jgi:hypothetical protein
VSQQINLFNPIFLKQKKIFAALPMAKALGVLLLGVLAFALYVKQKVAALQKEATASSLQLADKRTRQAAAMVEFAPRQKDPALVERLAAAEAELRALRKVASALHGGDFGNTDGYSPYFKAFARQSLDGLWLTGVAITGAGNELELRGRALQPALVPAYFSRLAREAVMQGRSFSSLRVSQPRRVGADGKEDAAGAPAPFVEFSLQSGAPAETAGAKDK